MNGEEGGGEGKGLEKEDRRSMSEGDRDRERW